MWVNGVEVGTWISPGDFGDKRGAYTPEWWKLEGSQYGLNKVWCVTEDGSFIDGVPISPVTIADLRLSEHHSVKVKIGIKEDAEHVGGAEHLRPRVRQLRSGHHVEDARVTRRRRRG